MTLLQGPIGGGATAGSGKVELTGGAVVITLGFPAKALADEALVKALALLPPPVAAIASLIVPEIDAALSVP